MAEGRQGNDESEPSVKFDYLKSPLFRVIRADGAIGAVTPNGHIHFALYSERLAIPREVVLKVTPEGELGEEIRGARVSRGGIVREMDVDVFVSVDVAQKLCDWLQERIEEAKGRQE